MKLNYARKILTVSILVFVIVLILDVIFTNLLLGKIVSINDKIKQLDISSQERLRALTLKDSIASSETEREKLQGYFVGAGNAQTVEFTKYLEELALSSGVTEKKTLADEVVSGLPNSEIVSVIRYRFNVSGKWANVYGFIQSIENLPKVSYLNSVTLSVSSEAVSAKDVKSGSKIWTADLDFSVVKLKK